MVNSLRQYSEYGIRGVTKCIKNRERIDEVQLIRPLL